MLKIKFLAVLCALLLLLTGCAAKDDFADYSVIEYSSVEYLSAETEFSEYDGSAENIWVYLDNNSDKEFHYDYWWKLEKKSNGEWKAIRFIKSIELDLADRSSGRGIIAIPCDLKDHVKQPLLPGHYRLWVGGEGNRVSAEFDIK